MIDPITNPQAWDVVYLGQVKSPGLAVVGEFPREYEWDVKKGKGTVGATTTFVQTPPTAGQIQFYFWRAEHFFEWSNFMPLLKYDPTKKTKTAIDLYHPSWDGLDFNSVYTKSIGNIIHQGQGMYVVKCSFGEYFPAVKKNATSTPSGSKTTQKGTTPGVPADPIGDAQQAEIAALLKKAAEP